MHASRALSLLAAVVTLAHCVGTAGGSGDAGLSTDGGPVIGTDSGVVSARDSGTAPVDAGIISRPDAGFVDDAGTAIQPVDAGRLPTRDAGPLPAYDGGPNVVVDFITLMAPNSWREIPNTFMSAVCPNVNHYQCEAVTSAWGGGAFDTVNDRLIIFGGGHNDSFVNNVFAFDLGPMKWVRMSELPPALDVDGPMPDVYRDIRLESCGLYPSVTTLSIPPEFLTASGYVLRPKCDDPIVASQMDTQQPRSTHTYGNVAFSQATKAFYNLGSSALYPSGQATATRVMSFDFGTRVWSRRAENNHIMIGAASATDGRGHIFYLTSNVLTEYDPIADTWTDLPAGNGTASYYSGAAVDTKRNRLMVTTNGVDIQTWRLSDSVIARLATTTTGLTVPIDSQLAFEYDATLDRYFAWAGSKTVNWLNPETEAWASSTGTDEDPGAKPANGVYGRMRYSKKYNVYVLVRAANQNVMLYKPPTVAP